MHQLYETLTLNERKSKELDIQPFFNSYGAMLYRMGIDESQRQEKKAALAYYSKASSFHWDKVAKAYLELVTLLWNDPEQAILFGKKALEVKNGLTLQESNDLLSLMVRAHKSAGHYDEARTYFNKWKKTQE